VSDPRISKTYVKYAYTMADLYDLARVAVLTHRSKLASYDYAELIDEAYSAACEYLVTCTWEPTELHVMNAAFEGARNTLRQQQQAHGIAKGDRMTGKQFHRYWTTPPVASPEDQLVEPMALRQIWATLSIMDRQTLMTAAMFPSSPERALHSGGITERAYEGRLRRARRNFNQFWFEGQSIPRTKGVRRIGSGFAARKEAA
jgi:hypothetical protein